MDPLYAVLGLSLLATLWFVPMGLFRLFAYRSGEIDHTEGMHNVARTILTIGLVCLAVTVVVAVMVLTRG